MLRRRTLPLALAELELPDEAVLLDLDDPRVLATEGLRPSQVATRSRVVTRPQALVPYHRHAVAAGLRWWSTYESLWGNVTLFDRAGPGLMVRETRELTLEDPAVVDAAELLGLRVA